MTHSTSSPVKLKSPENAAKALTIAEISKIHYSDQVAKAEERVNTSLSKEECIRLIRGSISEKEDTRIRGLEEAIAAVYGLIAAHKYSIDSLSGALKGYPGDELVGLEDNHAAILEHLAGISPDRKDDVKTIMSGLVEVEKHLNEHRLSPEKATYHYDKLTQEMISAYIKKAIKQKLITKKDVPAELQEYVPLSRVSRLRNFVRK